MAVTTLSPSYSDDDRGGAFERTPPQDLAAEQSVLGGVLLSKDAIADVVEVLNPYDFYRPAHSLVYEAALDLYSRGEPVDPVSVAAELTRAGSLAKVGGASYLHTLVASVPTAANAGYYARIVAEKAILRRLVEAGTRVVQLGYAGGVGGDVDNAVDRAQAEIYAVSERRSGEDYVALSELLNPTLEEIEAIAGREGGMSGVPTGIADLDRLTNGLHAGQLVIVAARPGLGKSTLALDFARAASIKHGLASVVFSLEMSKSEITMRLLSAEARVHLQHMRTGHMNDDDWGRLARRMGEVSSAPLFIDDSPHLTMTEIRAKTRRLKQRHDLRLVVVDYMQLLSSPHKVESRQQEVSEISRSMKLLAKELEVPVVALSQLNRLSEQRADKRPMLSDLRESGCLPASTKIWRADTGAEVTIGELFEKGERDIAVWSMNRRMQMVGRTMSHVFSTGVKEVFRVRLASGRTLEATANHPLYTYDGWRDLGTIAVGERLAVPRSTPEPLDAVAWPEHEIVLLAHLLGDGSMVARQPLRYASVDEANLSAVTAAASEFGVTGIRDEYPAARVTTLRLPAPYRLTHGRRNPIVAWLDSLGVWDKRSHEKFVPSGVFGLPNEQLALFLRHLWSTDGSIQLQKAGGVTVYYATTSRRLADDVARLLTRFGITARIKTARKDGYRDGYHVYVVGSEQQAIFLQRIGCHGKRGELVAPALATVTGVVANPNVDTVPKAVWDHVRTVLHEQRMPHREFAMAMSSQFCGSTMWKHSPSRARLARVAAILDDAELEMLATNDVFWDEIVAIESLGEQEVYDATVPGEHNFVADGVIVHNSLEQDADIVILLHRDDMYEKESARAGEADLIVAKHRNGPTDTVTVAFQGHYSRFVDMTAAPTPAPGPGYG